MSRLFVLLMFLLIVTVTYFLQRFEQSACFFIPQGYSFHPAHTWAVGEGGDSTRVGIDSFAVTLLGKLDQVEVVELNGWVRQGQKFMTMQADNLTVGIQSPSEGVSPASIVRRSKIRRLLLAIPTETNGSRPSSHPILRSTPRILYGRDGSSLDAEQC